MSFCDECSCGEWRTAGEELYDNFLNKDQEVHEAKQATEAQIDRLHAALDTKEDELNALPDGPDKTYRLAAVTQARETVFNHRVSWLAKHTTFQNTVPTSLSPFISALSQLGDDCTTQQVSDLADLMQPLYDAIEAAEPFLTENVMFESTLSGLEASVPEM